MITFDTRLPRQPEEFWLLIGRHCSGQASQPECDRLETYLQSSELARELFLDYLSIHAELQWRHRDTSMTDDDISTATIERHTPDHTPVANCISTGLKTSVLSLALSILVVASAFYGAFAFIAWNMRPDAYPRSTIGRVDPQVAPSSTNQSCVARVLATQGGELRHATTREALHEGVLLAEGDTLEVGMQAATLEFQDGASVTLQPSTRFRIDSKSSGFLDEGSLIATVPRRAVGFCIETSAVKVVDLGTEFGINVSKQGVVDVAVLSGKVEVANSQTLPDSRDALKTKKIVSAGEAVTVRRSATGHLTVTTAEFEQAVAALDAKDRRSRGHDREKRVAFQIPNGTAGNQSAFRGGIGIDFEVTTPIRVFNLGVFDHLGDGIDPSSTPTVQLWSRETKGTHEDATDDVGREVLGSVQFTAHDFGDLKKGHRFKALPQPVDLPVGAYSIVAYGLADSNSFLAFEDVDDVVNFRNDPGWVGFGNSQDGNRFGWSPSTSYAGGASGEIGGIFARCNGERTYGDAALSQTFSPHTSVTAAGSFCCSDLGTMDGQFFVGHYSTSSEFRAGEFIGMEFVEGGLYGFQVRARMYLRGGSFIDGARSDWIDLRPGARYQFEYTYDSTYENDASHVGPEGKLTLRVQSVGLRVETAAAVLEAIHRDSYALFDAFGIGIAPDSVSEDNANKTVQIYLDNVSYSGFQARSPAKTAVVASVKPLGKSEWWNDSMIPIGSRIEECSPGTFPTQAVGNVRISYAAGSFEYCQTELGSQPKAEGRGQ